MNDLILVTEFKKDGPKEIHEGDYYPIISLGLLYQEPTEQEPIQKLEQYNEYHPKFKAGEIKFNYLLSNLGETLLEHYYELFLEEKK